MQTKIKPAANQLAKLGYDTLASFACIIFWHKVRRTRIGLLSKPFGDGLKTGVVFAPQYFIRAKFEGSVDYICKGPGTSFCS